MSCTAYVEIFLSNKFVENERNWSGEYSTFIRLLSNFHAALMPLVDWKAAYVGVWAVGYRFCNHFMWFVQFFTPPPSVGGLDLDSRNSGCARQGGGVGPPLGVVVEELAVLVVLVRRHRHAVRAAVRRAVDDEVPGAIKEETGPFSRTTQYTI